MSDNWHFYAENGRVYVSRYDNLPPNAIRRSTHAEAQADADRQREGRIVMVWTGNQLDNARADEGIAADMIEQAKMEVAERLGRLING
jgi:hypothetical protein